ncbi:MAG: bifunctional phosphoribosyl-AMP cyclohydrolase/phosphoribosyl-ATP diphosphatase HisIE [Campylobacterales bacterium]|nr:bifunctional phosphoribosyl-AMP cyclohydrolase/phosphoribosyl-ATP diphosphatase HisIE [Campylobacterales bacterium]
MMNKDTIDWNKMQGLVPVITQDYLSNEVLMLAYMDKEAYDLSINTNYAHYYSRSKNRLWKKGETSGHTQEIQEILLDCDNDTILLKIKQNGVACHTGRKSCFFTNVKTNEIISDIEVDTKSTYGLIETLYQTICSKKNNDPEISYTAKLLQGNENSMLKKIVEESGEFTFAIKDNDTEEIIYEAADIIYHMLVALASKNISPDRVKTELERRFSISGIAEKNSRSK